MSTDFQRDVSAALHRLADEVPPPPVNLDLIRRGGRRRRMAAFSAGALAAAVLAAAAVVGVLHLPSAPAQLRVKPTSPTQAGPTPGQTASPTPALTPTPAQAEGSPLLNVEAFYSRCPAAEQQGQAAVDALIRTFAASWYAPILEAFTQHGYTGCATGTPSYAPAGQIGGQAIIVVTSSDAAGQAGYVIVTADQGTGLITGIAATSAGTTTAAYTSTYASNLYYVGGLSWLTLRRQGESPEQAAEHILGAGVYAGWSGGPEVGSPYLNGLQRAAPWPELTYDPLLCTSSGLPDVSVTDATVVADGEAGVAELTPSVGQPIVAVFTLSAQGYAVAAVACHQP
jgi:hypothetical protein